MKNIGKWKVRYGLKESKSIEKQTLVLILVSQKWGKNDAKRDLKSHLFWSKMHHEPPRFDLSLILGAMPKQPYSGGRPQKTKIN